MGDLSPSFNLSEFSCKCGCGLTNINMTLVALLQNVRNIIGQPIKINSGLRCPAHNASVGGAPDSSHLQGWAADCSVISSHYRYEFLANVMDQFERVGIAKTFVHVDVDPDKPKEVVWMY